MSNTSATIFDSASPLVGETEAPDAILVRNELRRILSSRAFHASRRGKEFLEYVVAQKLNGDGDQLKERLIGIKLFNRKPDYLTGEDPVVRVQAGDVRNRLERYYSDPECRPRVMIQIPLGSYAPIFSMPKEKASERQANDFAPAQDPSHDHVVEPRPAVRSVAESISATAILQDGLGAGEAVPPPVEPFARAYQAPAPPANPARTVVTALLVCFCVGLCLAAFFLHRRSSDVTRAFWAPASGAKSVLLCLPKPMVYRPAHKLFKRYEQAHPDAPITREARQDRYLALDPSTPILWEDMVPSYNAGPGIGGVVAALDITKSLTEQGIPFEVRFGDEASYVEMRGSPAVIIGAINTDWASQLTSGLSFVFDQSVDSPSIYEAEGAKRVWKSESSGGRTTRDYGLITRQVSGKSGQFLVQVAGITHYGTEAASELLLEKEELSNTLRMNKVDLKKNLQIVVSTDITNGRAGPPHVVAVKSW